MVVLEVDGRGAGGRGEDWSKKLVGQVGVVDVEDQILALKLVFLRFPSCIYLTCRYVISTLSFIDSSRLGVLGTNYGAFLAGMVVGQTKLGMCGVLTSPVVNWRHHGGEG